MLNRPRRSWAPIPMSTLVALSVVAVFVLVAVFAKQVTELFGDSPYTYHPDTLGPDSAPKGSFGGISLAHPFGVEPLSGRDMFAIVVYGARTSLLVGAAAAVITTVVIVAIGVSAGYFGGWPDRIISAVTNVLFGFPTLLFMIAVGAVISIDVPRVAIVIGVLAVFGWAGGSRVIRAQTRTIAGRNYVRYAAAVGASRRHIIVGEIVPNLRGTVIVFATTYVPGFIGTEAALSFLGVGVPPPTPSWGRSIGDAINWIQTDPWYLLFPGGALVLITLSLNEIGEFLRARLADVSTVRVAP
ncbi:ABC transporter permease [Williamsia sp. CHRR-6]|uniref:ABC transporter permease n=1 Tax=Williamsia sp. CHRR-6 TaxID=2835871 RepID=UPI001BDB395F|nr:ABC transporter permease [Williamsia sp. CHRR-6]MBT0565864.1 ABC transporter permease [Williamsia sp. CHRR-6]